MKTRSMLIGVAMAAVFNCAAVNAQVLGGLGGGLGGGLSGGLRDMNMATRGTLNGSLGADLDTSTLRRSTRDTAGRVTNRAHRTTGAMRDRATARVDRTREKVAETRQSATAATSAAAASAASAVKDVQIDGAANAAGSATSNVSRDGINLDGAAQGTGAMNGAALPQSQVSNVVPAQLAKADAVNVSNATQPAQNSTPAAQSAKEGATSGLFGENDSASGGLLDAPKSTATESSQPARGFDLAGDANGAASASRSGVAAEGGGSMSASRK